MESMHCRPGITSFIFILHLLENNQNKASYGIYLESEPVLLHNKISRPLLSNVDRRAQLSFSLKKKSCPCPIF